MERRKRGTHDGRTLPGGSIALSISLGLLLAVVPNSQAATLQNAGIGRANLDGSGLDRSYIPDPIPGGEVGAPTGIAVDGQHIYWVGGGASGDESIGRADLDGTGIDRRFMTVPGADDVAVDAGHIYWTDASTGRIGRANLDGSDVQPDFVQAGKRLVNLVVAGGHIFWLMRDSRATSYHNSGWIGRSNDDGTGVTQNFIRAEVIGDSGGGSLGGLAANSTHIFWTGGLSVGRATLDGSQVTQVFASQCDGHIASCSASSEAYAMVAATDRYLFFSGTWGPSYQGQIARASLERIDYGCIGGPPTIAGCPDFDATGIDGDFLVWSPEDFAFQGGMAVTEGGLYWTWGEAVRPLRFRVLSPGAQSPRDLSLRFRCGESPCSVSWSGKAVIRTRTGRATTFPLRERRYWTAVRAGETKHVALSFKAEKAPRRILRLIGGDRRARNSASVTVRLTAERYSPWVPQRDNARASIPLSRR